MDIAVLGPLAIEGNRGEPKAVGPRDRVVLAALAVHPGEVVSAEALADALWGARVPPSGTKIVQGCVVRLRKLLGVHAIETSPAGYRLAVPSEEIDARRFERAVSRARELLAANDPERSALVLADALTLWRGQPLSELEGWDPARIEAARLTELRHEAEELYVEAALRAGQHDWVLAKAQALVAEAPLRERRWVLLATAQYQSGRQSEALGTLRRLRTTLDRELGLDPAPDIDTLEQAILRQDPSLVAASALPEPSPICPYPGLKAYDVDDADGFFGRDSDIAACLHKLTTTPETSVLAVVGPSGCGKSSLVRAGVAAALRRDGKRVVVMTPGAHPVAALAAAMPGAASGGLAPVLVVDQCEEAFSLCTDPAARNAFLAALTAHAAVAPLIVALRADRIADLSAHPEVARTVEPGLYLLGGMTEADLRAAIEQPARLASLVVEPGLVDLLVDQVADQPGALPLMSHALAETWQRREGRTLTVAGYTASGGIRGAVAQTAEEVYDRLPAEQRGVLRDLLLRLVVPGREGEPVRSRLPRRLVVTGPDNDAMIDLLVAARLVTSDDGAVELAHESLARAWPRLRDWLDDDLEGQRILHHLAAAADTWDSLGRPDSELYRGVRLANALDWQHNTNPALTATEQDFLAESRRLSEAELRAAEEQARHQARVNRRLRAALTTAALLLVGALISGLIAVRQADSAVQQTTAAQQQQRLATARQLTAQADAARDTDPYTALLLGIAAERIHPDGQTQASLVNTLLSTTLAASLTGHGGRVAAIAYAPDGRSLATATASGDATVNFWDVTGRAAPRRLSEQPSGHHGPVVAVAYAPDGRTLATASDDQTVILWDVADRAAPQQLGAGPLTGHTDTVSGVAFSPDGRMLATSSGDRTVILWDLANPAAPRRLGRPLTGHTDTVTGVAFSPDGRTLATSSGDRTVNLWDLANPAAPRRLGPPLTGHTSEVTAVAFSPDRRTLATASADRTVNLWDLADRAAPRRLGRPLTGHTQSVTAVAFSPDGRTLATSSRDQTVALWDLAKPAAPRRLGRPLAAHTNTVTGVAFSPDGNTLATSSEDQTVNLWHVANPAAPRRLGPPLTGHTSEVTAVAFSPDRRTLATASADRTVNLWDLANPAAPQRLGRPLTGHTDTVTGVAFSPDGNTLATSSFDDTVILWDIAAKTAPRRLGRPLGHSGHVTSVAFTPDGGALVTQRLFGTVILWDVADRAAPRRLGEMATEQPASTMAFTPDGGTLATGSYDGTVILWDVADRAAPRRVGQRLTGHTEGVTGVAFSSDGRTLASSSEDRTVILWDLANPAAPRRLGRPLTGHTFEVTWVAFSPDGRTLASSDWHAVTLWDLADRAAPRRLGQPLTGHTEMVTRVAFAPDGRTLAASDDRTVILWDLSNLIELRANPAEWACTITGRGLDPDQWVRYISGLPYQNTCP